MSRAFVKGADEGPEQPLPRPVSDAPNYVTRRGMELLKQALADAEKAGDQREARYYRDRIATAILVEAKKQRKGTVAFGATVTAKDPNGRALRLTIVGEDEADPARGLVSWESPVARALEGHREGDRVTVDRPAGPIDYTIERVAYE